jgi:tetratricopeptide (TPR) repeat protein
MTGRRAWHGRAGITAVSLVALLGAANVAAWAQDAPVAVPVRFGAHPTYDRLVFDWPAGVQYRVDQQGSTATVTFDRSASIDEARIKSDLSRVAPVVSVAQADGATTITLQLGDGIHLRHFRSGSKVILDFSRTENSPPPPSSPPPQQQTAAAAPPRPASDAPWDQPSQPSTGARPPAQQPAPAAAASDATPPWGPPGTPAPATSAPPAAAAATAPPQATPAAPPPAAAPAAARPSPAVTALAPPGSVAQPWNQGAGASAAPVSPVPAPPGAALPLPTEQEVATQVRDQAQQLATSPPVRLTPPSPPAPAANAPAATPRPAASAPAANDARTAPARAAGGTTAPPERSQAFLDAQAKRTAARIAAAETKALGPPIQVVRSEGQGLRFKWPDPVTAAAFARGPYVFLLFNKRALFDLSAVKKAPPEDLVGDIAAVPSEGAAIRLTPPPNTYFAIRAEDNDWVIEMTRRPRTPDAPAEITTLNEGDADAARVQVAMRGGEAVVALHDPEIGDDLKIVPTAVAGAGIEEEHDFPQFDILASSQGLVVKPRADGLIVRPLGRYVEIYSPGGTLLSPPDEATAADRTVDTGVEGQQHLFNFADWRRDDGRPYLMRLRELEQAVAAAPSNQRNPPRLALARFLFANGYAVEADGVLATMAQDQPAVANTRLYHALKGATSFIAGNLDEATTHLRHASLDREPEIAMWRAALDMAQGDQAAAIEQLSRGPDFTRRYPDPYANRLGLAISEALIDLGDIPAARDRLEAVFANAPTASEDGQARFLRGRLALLEGRPDEARSIWTALERGDPSPARVLASLSLVDLDTKENRITPTQAANRIEQLRYVWRGDDLEFAVLRKLGELALDSGDIRKGLRSLRDLIALKPDSREVAAVTRRMSAAFQKFFLEGGADKLTPVAAIGMFNEFKNLVPEGPAGDAMIRNLADRLIKVDLLDQAAELLDNQIKNRLDGPAKAETGARLAFVRLLDGKPNDALAALSDTEAPGLPEEVARDRNRLAARALMDIDRAPDALARIAGDTTRDADVLRAEINWKSSNWAGAADALGRLAGDPPAGDAAMPDDQARRVVRYAAALALAGDQAGIDGARTKYATAMNRGPYKDIFAVLASDKPGPLPDVRDIQSRLATTAPFDTFLSAYRQRFDAATANRS